MSLKTFINGTWKQIVQYIPNASDALPQAAGKASAGTSDDFSRADHVHPSQAVPTASSTAPKAPGTATAGTSDEYSRADHVHPLGTASAGAVTLKGTRTTAGNWSLTGLKVGVPLYFLAQLGVDYGYVSIRALSGTNETTNDWLMLGNRSGAPSSNVFIVIPTATTVTVNIYAMSASSTVRAYQ